MIAQGLSPDLSSKQQTKEVSDSGRMGDNEAETLTDPSPIPKCRRTRFWLRMISQEPFRIEFHRIGISSWVVQNLPV